MKSRSALTAAPARRAGASSVRPSRPACLAFPQTRQTARTSRRVGLLASAVFPAVAVMLSASPSQADPLEYIWNYPGVSNYLDSGNWSLLGVPGANDIARIGDATGSLKGAFLDGAAEIGELYLGRNDSDPTLAIRGSGSLTVHSRLNLDGGAGMSLLKIGDIGVPGGSLTISDNADFIVSTGSTVRLENGGSLTTGGKGVQLAGGRVEIRDGAGAINGAISGNGVVVPLQSTEYALGAIVSGTVGVTQLGSGTTLLTGENSYTQGTTLMAGVVVVSKNENLGAPNGLLHFGGGMLRTTAGFTMNRPTVTGALSPAVFDVVSGTLVQQGTIGGGGGLRKQGDGTLTLTGNNTYTGSTSVNRGTLIVTGASNQGTAEYSIGADNGDDGTLILAGGGSILSGTVAIGKYAGATGSATVTGSGSAWTSSNQFHVGFGGTGDLTIAAGGTVSNTAGYIGTNADATGTVLVTGQGSAWDNSTALYVGWRGTGTLRIEDGGSVSNIQSSVGYQADSAGTVVVTGPGSVWTNSANLIIGQIGNGTLSILEGGTVSNKTGIIGQTGSATGAALVSGQGSAWVNSTALTVGYLASGSLTIAEGGRVNVASGTGIVDLALNAGSSGTLNIGAAAGSAAVGAGTLDAAEVRFGAGSGRIVFNHTETGYTFAPKITGAGTLDHLAGTTLLTADNSGFTGPAQVQGGTLVVNGALGAATTVLDGGTLTGTGSIAAAVNVGAGGMLSGVQGKTLSMQSLTLDAGAFITASLGTPDGAGPLFTVADNLVLDGTLNIADLGGLATGIYSLVSYGGTLTDNGLVIGNTPGGTTATDFGIQTSVAGKVNLISTVGTELGFWDGSDSA